MPEIRSQGATIHYRETGEGSPVIALHGWGSIGAQWRGLAGYLRGRHRVVTPDLAGCGRSGRPTGLQDLRDEALFLAPLLDAASGPVHLVGHGFGGAVALELAVARPWSVGSLTLIEPAAFQLLAGREPALSEEIMRLDATVTGCARRGERAAASEAFVDYWAGEGAWSRTSDALRGVLAARLERTIGQSARIAATPPAEFSALGCPTLAVAGLDSPLPAIRTTELVAEAIPGARLVLLEAGHLAPFTDPHVVDPLIGAHLARALNPAVAAAA